MKLAPWLMIVMCLTGCQYTHLQGGAAVGEKGASPWAAPLGMNNTTQVNQGLASLIPGQTIPSREEEIWIISASKPQPPASSSEAGPGGGMMLAREGTDGEARPVPLKHTDVKASIAGYMATVDVTQSYLNPFSSKIEAIYVFPLPHNAAVNEFVMTIGSRKIRGVIRERIEAERLYTEARRQGYVVSMLTQERPNIFTQKVANIEPGQAIDVQIRYFHALDYEDGWLAWHFPMVVGPRFTPPGISPPEQPDYVKPDQRPGHDIRLAVEVKAGTAIEELNVDSHAAQIFKEGREAQVTLAAPDSIPNRDFVMRFRVAGDQARPAMVTQRDGRDTYFSLVLYPPASLQSLKRNPVELVYVLDCSGSMDGRPLAQAKSAIRASLKRMEPRDTFQVIRFSNDVQMMSSRAMEATPENIDRASRYLETSFGGGGTYMLDGIRKALESPADPGRVRFICFLTDGFIGNETDILAEIHRSLGNSRIFSFGVGSSVNRYLLDHMAKAGRGAAAYVSLKEAAEPVMNAFFDRISHPAMTGIEIDLGGMTGAEVFPKRPPDLFSGRPVILCGKAPGSFQGQVKVSGRIGEARLVIPVTPVAAEGSMNMLRVVWARMKVAELVDEATRGQVADFSGRIRELALEHNLLSAFTAFIAVDSTRVTEGQSGTSVRVPAAPPEGTSYPTDGRRD